MTPAERILAWLRASAVPLSGEELARRLGCSRAAVWKHMARLRARGYAIAARHARGYVLAAVPDRVGPAELAPHLTGRWRRIEWRAEIDSTQRLARELARAGAEEGTCVIAEAQSAGRGRLGRTWHSPPGTNLYCSVVLRPPLAPAAVPQIALVAGVAVAAAVAETTTLAVEIKWPNDVLVGGRKVAGVLTELEAELERVRFVIVGIGVNLNTTAFPAELAARATSLALAERYGRFLAGGFAAVRAEWEARSALTGKTVRVSGPDGAVSGRVLGVDDAGALRLLTDAGERRIVAGEVTLR